MRRLALALALIGILAACGGSPGSPSAAPSTGQPLPVNARISPTVPVPTAAPPACDARASLRPQGAAPQPGQMPAGSTMAEIQRRGRLVVGIDQNAYLFAYRDRTSGRLVGFEVDIARAIAKAIFGNENAVQFQHITTAARIPSITGHKVDMVIRTMTMNCDRWQQVDFSTEYLTSHQKFLVNKGSSIRSIADIGGKRVCATYGSTSIVKLASLPQHPIPVGTDSTLDCLVLLQQGQIDAVSTNDTLLAGLAAQDPGTEIVGKALTDEPSGVGIPKDHQDLTRFVNRVLEDYRSSGAWQRSYQKWLAPRLGSATPPAARYSD